MADSLLYRNYICWSYFKGTPEQEDRTSQCHGVELAWYATGRLVERWLHAWPGRSHVPALTETAQP